ncbi:MAG: YihY/virulence factor BrkB family protein [Armatimonadota bacterium]|nr:YihY/virulence factor BrkB family protein [Armatimonadota bacterium]MDR7563656.1 YihY/virulence factor BrkB family protein [Armatimonadota bacterium]MDR7567456.1 YihY/virulence factor BrkB family protein [Armatimonadota bacterium]MDR7602271.1 YihY/virulence factor BrkB family protein [Armatimonadota bacterium]
MNAVPRLVRAALQGFLDHDGTILAAAIAYHVLLSVFPLLLAAVASAAFFVDQADLRASLVRTLALYLPPQARDVVLRNLDEAIRARGTVGIAAIATFIWTSSAAAGVARHSLNRIWGVRHPRAYWRRKAVELVSTLLVGMILGTSLVFSVLLSLTERFASESLAQELRRLSGSWGIRVLFPFILAFLAFLVAYRLLPNCRIPWRSLWPGALTATALFELARQGMFWGVGRIVHYQLVYGSLTGVVVFLVWGYVVAAVFLLGAEVSRSAHHLQGAVRVPDHDEVP